MMMITKVSIPEREPRLTTSESSVRIGDAEPDEDPVLADAEQEEMAELWAHDTGNQGA